MRRKMAAAVAVTVPLVCSSFLPGQQTPNRPTQQTRPQTAQQPRERTAQQTPPRSAEQPPERTARQQRAEADLRPARPVEPPADVRPANVSDAALAQWLAVHQAEHAALAQFAIQQTQNAQVRQYAQDVARTHRNLAERLQVLASQMNPPANDPGVSGVLEDLGAELQDRLEERRLERDRAVEPAEGDVDRPRREGPLRRILERRRQNTGDSAGDAPEERRRLRRDANERNVDVQVGDQEVQVDVDPPAGAGRTDEAIRGDEGADQPVAEGGEEDRRERLRRALPLLRQNMPEILELIGQAAESEQGINSPWLRFHNELTRRQRQAIQEEIRRHRGAAFDQAYLGYEVLSHVQMREALQLAQATAGQDLRPLLDNALTTADEHLQQARQLMQQQ